MQYLMMDMHQRFLGTLNHNASLSIGDILKADAKTYTVVGIDAARKPQRRNMKSVTVIPSGAAKAN